MSENFVGFSQSPKPAVGTELQVRKLQWQTSTPLIDFLPRLTTQSGLGSWLGTIIKFDFRQGGKLKYQSQEQEFGATYSAIQIPKLLVLNTESVGELEFRFRDKKAIAEITLTIKRHVTPQEKQPWLDLVTNIERDLGGL